LLLFCFVVLLLLLLLLLLYSAHTTQFVKVGWYYLQHGSGVYALAHGGSMVSLISPDEKDLTVVVETMVADLSHLLSSAFTGLTRQIEIQ